MLNRKILSWNFYDIMKCSNFDQKHYNLSMVPQTFETFQKYIEIFEPLLLEECVAQIKRGRDEQMCSSNFANKVYLKSKEIIQNFIFLKFTFEKVTSTYNENDIVIVTKDRYLSDEAEKDGILHMFGSVNSLSNNENICLNTFLNLASQTDIFKGISRINHLKTSLEINSYWFLLRICNFSTISREYAALWNI